MSTFHFNDPRRACHITDPVTPRPWINYLGNRKLRAFISQNAGGLLWYLEPCTRRISRYHYLAPPGDRPGFYVYVRDLEEGVIWNPHFAPSCTALDFFEAVHSPGITSVTARRQDIELHVRYTIPPDDDVMLWALNVRNLSDQTRHIELCSYLEFGLLEFLRESIGWCYLQNQFSLRYDAESQAILYDYHVFEAPYTPAMAFGCSCPPSGWECSRDAFIGTTGSLSAPCALQPGQVLSNSDLPLGGHACAALGRTFDLAPGEEQAYSYCFALAPTESKAKQQLAHYRVPARVAAAFQATEDFWAARLSTFSISTGEAPTDRMINAWNPYNCVVALETARSISTDHMGTDAMRFRDTMQDALAVAHIDNSFSRQMMTEVLAQQTADGGGCMTFYPHTTRPTSYVPKRCDNTVWPVYTCKALIAETGDTALLQQPVPYHDGGTASVYEHLLLGLKYILDRCGPHGLPLLFHADWNDGLALFEDEQAESVMLGLQLVHALKECAALARLCGKEADALWCEQTAQSLSTRLNEPAIWDGAWYRRLLLSNGKTVGSDENAQGKIFLNPQSWAVISGVGAEKDRGRQAMDAAHEQLSTPYGLRILSPAYRGFPEPTDPPKGSNPGVGENGGIFCHANTWAIIADCLLGHGDRAFATWHQLLPESIIDKVGPRHYQREPYVYVSSIVGPGSDRFGRGGISWLTGTASWMYVAFTQYILGIRPELQGLRIQPCLPSHLDHIKIKRIFRGTTYNIEIENKGSGPVRLTVDGANVPATAIIPPTANPSCSVRCVRGD